MKNLIWKPTPPPARVFKKKSLTELIKISQFVYQVGEHESLRKPSKPVPVRHIRAFTTQEKLRYLKKCLDRFRRITKGKGRGIAAVQVGIPEQIVLLYMPSRKKKYRFFINPNVTRVSTARYRYEESCMSCNLLVAPVVRPAWVEVLYFDEDGEKQVWRERGSTKEGKLYNRVLQHEIDHLRGIINIDKVKSKELFFESNDRAYEKTSFEKVSGTSD